jgi:hypothetical protein
VEKVNAKKIDLNPITYGEKGELGYKNGNGETYPQRQCKGQPG